MTKPTDTEALHAECKRRFQRSRPTMTDEQWSDWLTDALTHGARIVLTIGDGAYAAYDRQSTPACQRCAATAAHKDPQ